MKKFLSTIILIIAVAVSAAAADKVTTAFTVTPKMHCVNCENKIKNNLRHEKGVTAIATSIKAQTVTVTYDPAKTDAARLAAALKRLGYTATPQKK